MVTFPDFRERKLISPLTVRQYQEKDKDAVWALHVRAMSVIGVNTGKKGRHKDFDSITDTYLNNGGDFLVGEVDGKIVAMGGLKKTGTEGVGEIVRMRVDPDTQHVGYGKQILKKLEAHALQLGYHTLTLSTSNLQIAALAFYPKMGYPEIRKELSPIPQLAERGIMISHFQKVIK
ncbi:GNAT family N-acetyltransferase [Candidatus Roizmanbacteria bacterium]|nr:GNAT family N-acetyltransferase [Candidatus Roizmanbacteria bacterium]